MSYINDADFTRESIIEKRESLSEVDPAFIEKTIYAMELVGQLALMDLSFVFKGAPAYYSSIPHSGASPLMSIFLPRQRKKNLFPFSNRSLTIHTSSGGRNRYEVNHKCLKAINVFISILR